MSPGFLLADDTKYQTPQEAYAVGVAFLSQNNFAASREPLEAALKLTNDDAFRLKVYEALMPAYRQLTEPDKYMDASDFVLRHSEQAARRSLTRRSLLAFVFQRGQTDALIKRYEDALTEDKDDRTALYVLAEAYGQIKNDATKSAQYTERLAKLDKESGEPIDVQQQADLATQYVRAKKYKEGAQIFEKIAPLDERLESWHWKEAAQAWLKAGDKKKALKDAKKADENGPDTRSDLLTHFWHRNLADVFLATDEPKLAIPHYKAAIKSTNIDGYVKDCKASLELAEQKAKAKR
ncbi:MAG: tetratricopeptide repeat protein [Planctomycetaceae bacterium]